MTQTDTYLLVEQLGREPKDFTALIKELNIRHGLDLYQARQRLIGQGLSLLTRGKRTKLEQVSKSLTAAKIPHWLIDPSKPSFAPKRIRGLEQTSSSLDFETHKGEVTFPHDSRVLAVLGDISGNLAEQSVKQLLSSHAYRGIDNVSHIDENKTLKSILQGSPILDLYLLDGKGTPTNAVRALPGKFAPQGLGERATLSSRQNLIQLIEIVREKAAKFDLFTDFGLVNLPGCTLRRGPKDDPETNRLNLIGLVRYGWLMGDLLQAQERVKKEPPPVAMTPGDLATAALVLQNPALAGSDGEPLTTLKDELNQAASEADKDAIGSPLPSKAQPKTLPAPPPQQSGAHWDHWAFIRNGGAAVAFILIAMGLKYYDRGDRISRFCGEAFYSGALPLVAALLLLWGAFYFLRLKRKIENTPTSRIRSAAMGMVEVKGKAIRRYALVSPMAHIPCVYYRLTRYKRDKNNQWKKVGVTKSSRASFLLEDETGRIEIDPARCRVTAGTKQEGHEGNTGFILSNNAEEKWVENIIVEGALIYVLGFAASRPKTGPSRHDRKIEALRDLKSDPQLLQRYDQDGDGKIDADEWEAARQDIDERLTRESLLQRQKRRKQEEQIVIGYRKGYPLIISESHSERQLTQRYFWYSLPLLSSGCIATIWAIILLFRYTQ
jgi:hypothetical protein